MMLNLYWGTVESVDVVNRGVRIRSSCGALVPPAPGYAPLRLSPDDQYMPEVGDGIVYVQQESGTADYWIQPLVFYANQSSKERLRIGDYPQAPGEKQVQGSGGSYVSFDALGNVYVVDGAMGGYIKLDVLAQETDMQNSRVVMRTSNGVSVSVDKVGAASIESSVAGEVVKKVVLDKDGILLDYDGSQSIIKMNDDGIVFKSPNIFMDGNVFMGSGASDPALRASFGDVVTGGALGTHPVDYVTGIPIIGSTTIKAKGV